jgi:hypothetical protein
MEEDGNREDANGHAKRNANGHAAAAAEPADNGKEGGGGSPRKKGFTTLEEGSIGQLALQPLYQCTSATSLSAVRRRPRRSWRRRHARQCSG